MLFVAAKVSQFALLPQGRVEATERVLNMVNKWNTKVLVTVPIQVPAK